MYAQASGRPAGFPDPDGRPFALFWALQDETARMILSHTTGTARSAKELASFSDVSIDTIYRRLHTLEAHGLMHERHRIDEQGNQYRVYSSVISRVEVELREDEIRTHVEEREDTADRFTRLWESIPK